MPLFEYRCRECGRRYSLLLGVTADQPKRRCPQCGSRKATKLISRIAPVVHGDDFDDLDGDYDDDE